MSGLPCWACWYLLLETTKIFDVKRGLAEMFRCWMNQVRVEISGQRYIIWHFSPSVRHLVHAFHIGSLLYASVSHKYSTRSEEHIIHCEHKGTFPVGCDWAKMMEVRRQGEIEGSKRNWPKCFFNGKKNRKIVGKRTRAISSAAAVWEMNTACRAKLLNVGLWDNPPYTLCSTAT